jgi:hypothetical protein
MGEARGEETWSDNKKKISFEMNVVKELTNGGD